MSTATQFDQPGQRSTGLTLSLSSNNPFRNRAASPTSLPDTPASPFDDPPPRPVSRNPFLDPATNLPRQSMTSPPPMASPKPDSTSPTAEQLFDALTVEDPKPAPPPGPPGPRGQMRRPGPPRGENVPPPGRRPPPLHRPSQSQEEALRARGAPPRAGPYDSPQKRMERRPRRNSESSITAGDKEKPLTDEEKKAKEMRRRERERRHRERESNRDRSKPTTRYLDPIDQLDHANFFHHDGPYDALTSRRNKKGNAPMQAFPKDSLNNVLGGSGPLNKRPDHATFMGNNDTEAFKDYSNKADKQGSSAGPLPPVWDPMSRGSILHGDESMGLGTTTFLEGTPAARTVIQEAERAQSEKIAEGGLQRNKSLAQRIRGMKRPGPREYNPSGRMTNPDGAYASRRSPPVPGHASSASMQSGSGERNPFFADYDSRGDSNAKRGEATSPTSPVPGSLERRATTDSTSNGAPNDVQAAKPSGGLLARVKSLKGGRRPRPNISGPIAAPAQASPQSPEYPPAVPPRDDLPPVPPGTAA